MPVGHFGSRGATETNLRAGAEATIELQGSLGCTTVESCVEGLDATMG
jgi:hypothetical protein